MTDLTKIASLTHWEIQPAGLCSSAYATAPARWEKLKHYIDLLVHRELTFSFTPGEGYKGLGQTARSSLRARRRVQVPVAARKAGINRASI